MSDRTEEAKALRGWMDVYSITLAGLEKVTREMRHGGLMLDNMAGCKRALLKILAKHGVVEYAYGTKCLEWATRSCALSASGTYRIKPGYELPDLTEVTPPRYANGTWIVQTDARGCEVAWQVVDRSTYRSEHGPINDERMSDWCAVSMYGEGHVSWVLFDHDNFQELPPMPDKAKLEAQGYRLTMKAAGCGGYGNSGTGLIVHKDGSEVYPVDHYTDPYEFNGWRWLVEKIEQESEEVEMSCEMDCMAKQLKEYCHEFGMYQIHGSDIIPLRATIMNWSNQLKGAE